MNMNQEQQRPQMSGVRPPIAGMRPPLVQQQPGVRPVGGNYYNLFLSVVYIR